MVFDKHTKKKADVWGYQLLLVDRHYNHINLNFFDYADQNQIIVLVLPLYAIYWLQLLDIGLFLSLNKVYS